MCIAFTALWSAEGVLKCATEINFDLTCVQTNYIKSNCLDHLFKVSNDS